MARTSLTIVDGFAPILAAAGLDRFDRVMDVSAPPGAVTRAVPGRFTTRIEAAGAGMFLKRYRGLARARSAGREWRMLRAVAAAGIPCPTPVAWGERRGIFGPRESFLITAEIPQAEQADWWIRERPSKRSELVRAVAELARQFHAAGFHHRDFYLCHFFVSEGTAGLELFLIDFQRARRLGWRRRRWLVKDLAQLHFSLGQAGFAAEDWEEFLRSYGPAGAGIEGAVLAKSARIARHVPRYR